MAPEPCIDTSSSGPPDPPARRSSRLSNSRENADVSDDIQVSKPPRLDRKELYAFSLPSSASPNALSLFRYPLEGTSVLQVTRDAMYRLKDGDFLNDVFIEFGIM
jgi:Ulp1 family protease